MRLLAHNIDNEIIEKLENEGYYIVDKTEDVDETLYHLQVRFYNLVILFENDKKDCLRLLKESKNSNTAFIVLTMNDDKKFYLKCFKNGALCVLKTPFDNELLLAKIESIHRENFASVVYYKEYFAINTKEKEIVDFQNNELAIKGKAYDILGYLYKNRYRPPISKDEMIYALWDDPEMVCQNVIEVNINQIRTKLKKRFGVDLIDTVRNRGYKMMDKDNKRDRINV
jgi:two-component system OmpR family response regulator